MTNTGCKVNITSLGTAVAEARRVPLTSRDHLHDFMREQYNAGAPIEMEVRYADREGRIVTMGSTSGEWDAMRSERAAGGAAELNVLWWRVGDTPAGAALAPDKPSPPPVVAHPSASAGVTPASAAPTAPAEPLPPNEFSNEWAGQLQAAIGASAPLTVAPFRAILPASSASYVTFAAKHPLTVFGGDSRRSVFRVRVEWGISRGGHAWVGLLPAGTAPGPGDIAALGGAGVLIGPANDMFVQGWRFHPSKQALMRTPVPEEAEVQITLVERGAAELAVFHADEPNVPVMSLQLAFEGGLAKADKLVPAVSLRAHGIVMTIVE